MLGDVGGAEVLPRRAEIERLALRHALPAAGLGQQQDQLGANGGIGMGARVAQDLEGQRQKGVAGQDGGRLVEGDVQGRAPAAQRVVVHRRQVVMHQRVAMDAFERAGGGKRVVFLDAEQSRRFDQKKGPQPLAAAKRRIAHGLAEPGLFGVAVRPWGSRRSSRVSTALATRSSCVRKDILGKA